MFGMRLLVNFRLDLLLVILLLSLPLLSGCGIQELENVGTLIVPPAQTIAARGGQVAQTQAAKLLQTAQVSFATESSHLKETAKAQAATIAASYIETAQSGLVTQSAGQITQGPTQIIEIKDTALALAATQAAEKLPFLKTQAALLRLTLEARLGTEWATPVPVDLTQIPQATIDPQPVLDIQATQAALLTQVARFTSLPPVLPEGGTFIPPQQFPTQTPDPGFTLPEATLPPITGAPRNYIASYTVQPGDTLRKIANRFSIPRDRLFQLNQQRFTAEGIDPELLVPGEILLIALHPQNLTLFPGMPAELRQSNLPECNVSSVDWLQPPVVCEPYVFRVVTSVDNSLECVTADNPFGYQLTQTVYSGWFLLDAANTLSYGWFYNQAHDTVVIGPALVSGQSSYQECGIPGH